MERIYRFECSEFKKAYRLADDVYSLVVVLDGFCKFHKEDEGVKDLLPFVEFLKKKIDKLNGFFIDVDLNMMNDE